MLAMCVLHVIQFLLTFLQSLRYGAHRSINISLWIKIKECKTVLMSFQKRKEATRNALQIYFSLLFFLFYFLSHCLAELVVVLNCQCVAPSFASELFGEN